MPLCPAYFLTHSLSLFFNLSQTSLIQIFTTLSLASVTAHQVAMTTLQKYSKSQDFYETS